MIRPSAIGAVIRRICVVASTAGALFAQAENEPRAPLAKPVFRELEWLEDFDLAKSRAGSEGKLIFAYFTRSYVA